MREILMIKREIVALSLRFSKGLIFMPALFFCKSGLFSQH
jgi:hypothetical protein